MCTYTHVSCASTALYMTSFDIKGSNILIGRIDRQTDRHNPYTQTKTKKCRWLQLYTASTCFRTVEVHFLCTYTRSNDYFMIEMRPTQWVTFFPGRPDMDYWSFIHTCTISTQVVEDFIGASNRSEPLTWCALFGTSKDIAILHYVGAGKMSNAISKHTNALA